MNETEMIEKITRTEAIAEQNKTEIHDIKEEIADIKENNKAIYDIATSVKLMAQDMTTVKTTVGEVKKEQKETRQEINEIKNNSLTKKAKMFDKAIGAVLGAIGTGILVYVLHGLFPSLF